jgi:hypothetical protein
VEPTGADPNQGIKSFKFIIRTPIPNTENLVQTKFLNTVIRNRYSTGTAKRKNVLLPGLWIRIRIGSEFNDFVDPDWIRNPDPGVGK